MEVIHKDNESEETGRNEQACVDTPEESQFPEHNKNEMEFQT